jgi:antitoxin HigA-1
LSDISVTDAAKRLGVGRVALSRLLNGATGIGPEMALRLSKALGIDVLHEIDQAVGRSRCNLRGRAQITPTIVHGFQIGRIIILDRLEQLLKPFRTRCLITRRLCDEGHERIDGGMRCVARRARRAMHLLQRG